jgi:hypothetical protein
VRPQRSPAVTPAKRSDAIWKPSRCMGGAVGEGPGAGSSSIDDFEFGLVRVLDGIEARKPRARGRPRRRAARRK